MNMMFSQRRLVVSMTVFFLLVSSFVIAQTNTRDVVYLKNGSIIKGDILEVVPNESLKIKTSDGSIFVFKMEEVDRTGKEESEKNQTSGPGKDRPHPKSSGYLLMVRLGPNLETSDGKSNFSGGIINAFQVNPYISLGIGAEATNYVYHEISNSSVMIYPVFFDARFYDARRTVQPMFSAQVGYGIVGNKKNRMDGSNGSYVDFEPSTGEGGFFFAFYGGIRMQVTKRTAIVVDGGVTRQNLKGTRSYSPATTVVEEITSLRGNIGVCWNFGRDKK